MTSPQVNSFSFKDLPLWSMIVFVIGLIFSGGKIYSEQQFMQKEIEAQEADYSNLKRDIESLTKAQYETLVEIRVISTDIGELKESLKDFKQRSGYPY